MVGLLLGSFANVLIHRIPRGESIVRPASRCPACGRPVRPGENIPVLSWLWLRGRCAGCQAPISGRYPLVELTVGIGFFVVVWAMGATWQALAVVALVYFGVVLSAIDLEHHRLPDRLTGAFAIVAGLCVLGVGVSAGSWEAPLRALVGAAALGLLYGVTFVVYPRGMGFGDVKLAPSIGAVLGVLGWAPLVVGAFAAFLWGAIAGVVTMVRSGRRKGVGIPFGPWMFVGALTGVLAGDAIADWYLGLMGL
ncbi:prepilin peptidase [Demequina sp. SYSU T0a273]|uniref:Prepilin peptidase n=1 Tax=Demequina lignilytica TaxID=3051663 RepID=A0AB35ME78_9MICO|nr:A24 family peptidase [Demequina sp. SYSU T0a273]MDN4482050.1 prepilin peptidase [Demequina sp. SYSU T0a273]